MNLTNLDPSVEKACLEAIRSLTDNEYAVVSVMLGLNPLGVVLRKSQIAKLLGISPTRVTTILNSAYRKLSVPEMRECLSAYIVSAKSN